MDLQNKETSEFFKSRILIVYVLMFIIIPDYKSRREVSRSLSKVLTVQVTIQDGLQLNNYNITYCTLYNIFNILKETFIINDM